MRLRGRELRSLGCLTRTEQWSVPMEVRFALAALYFATQEDGSGTDSAWTKCGTNDSLCGSAYSSGGPTNRDADLNPACVRPKSKKAR